MKKLVITLALFALSLVANAKEVIIDVPSIIGKSKAEVSSLIGKPTSCDSSKYGEKCQFKRGETEIVFIKGKADWITVEDLDNHPFTNSTIILLGFKLQTPSFSNAFTKRWEPLQGLKSVSLFKGENNSDYAYIKAYTK